MPNLNVGALIIRSQMFHILWKAAFEGLNVPQIECCQISFFCKVLAYEIESPSTPSNLNTTMTTGSDLPILPQFLLQESKVASLLH